jgi:hypothetical protein
MLPNDTENDLVFFGGKDYLPLFHSLTATNRSKKIVFFNSVHVPNIPGYLFRRFETKTKTNWHYGCAKAYLDGTNLEANL